MSSGRQTLLFVVCLFALTLGALIFIGVRVGSKWETFIPDLIIGVVGAGAIGGILFLAERRAEAARGRAEKLAAAYELLLESLTNARTNDLRRSYDSKLLPAIATRARQLYELVKDEDLGRWFEAERQLSLSRMKDTMDLLEELTDDSSIDDEMKALEPYLRWGAEFGSNIRFWRTGKLDAAMMREQSRRIEEGLRKKDRWRSSAMPWRDTAAEQPPPSDD